MIHPDASVRRRVAARLVQPLPSDPVAGWVAPAALFLVALLMRLHRLGVPKADMFDEVYYACEARSLLRHGYEVTHKDRAAGFCLEDPSVPYGDFVVHPPLGKWAIAVGEWMFGFNSFGWRFSAAVAGALSVLLLARIGRRMFRSTFLGCLAASVMAFDALHFVQSRIAMLDIFLLLWLVAAFGCLVVDRDDGRARLSARLDDHSSRAGPKLGTRWWRLGAGACLGAAVATKWSGLYFVGAFGLLALAWDVGARRTAGVTRPFLAALRRDSLSLLGILVVAAAVYVGSWAGWFASDAAWRRDAGTFDANLEDPQRHGAVGGFFEYHEDIWTFHQNLSEPHGYQSKPETWFLLVRPVAYHYPTLEAGQSQAVLGVGSPAVWWASIAAFVGVGWAWVSRRDWRAAALLVVVAAAYLPWFLERERTMFLFYALPLLPFMALAIAYCAGMAISGPGRPRRRRVVGAGAVGLYAAAVVMNFRYLYPVIAARMIPTAEWADRMLFATWI
ncbi:MAG TPA: phospholipid carrier-dependent glycosyltransferase [Mycobacteriales bacterium]|nr:phospholipid carrier-dependent glycosyltransferase [Mycobacteriales bacterium]